VAASLRETLPDADESTVAAVADALEAAVDGLDGTGRPLFTALRSAPRSTDPFGRLWRAADLVSEHRGDGHIATYVAEALDPCRMNILTELWLGFPLGEYSGTRAWPQQATDTALNSLRASGLLDGDELSKSGRALREAIEVRTDDTQHALVDALGGGLDGAAEQLARWSQQCVTAGFFPPDPRKRAAG
jgi:hypothetical protein